MNIYTNDALIRRNATISRVTMVAGLLILVAGMIISFRNPEQFGLSAAALLVGFTVSQISIYYANRWGRRPRPDELLNQALKGLDGKYSIYHYLTPAAHLLVGPAGVWVLAPRHQRGTITYSNGRWRQRGGNLYLKIFAQEGLGRPDLEIEGEVQGLLRYLGKELPEDKIPPVNAALIFTNEKAVIQLDETANPPATTLQLAKLKDYVRKVAKTKPLSTEHIQEIQRLLTQN